MDQHGRKDSERRRSLQGRKSTDRHKRGKIETGGNLHNRRNSGDQDPQEKEDNSTQIIRPLGYKTLEQIATLRPSEALHNLASYKKRFVKLIKESEIRFDLMTQLIGALSQACTCETSSETLFDIIATLQAENFVSIHLAKYVRDWPIRITMQNSFKEIVPSAMQIVLIIVSSLLSKIPSSFNEIGVILLCLDSSIDRCRKEGVVFSTELLRKLEDVKEFHTTIETQEYARLCSKKVTYLNKEATNESVPEDDFRQYPIFPMADELKDSYRPSLRKNIVNGRYEDIHHYLDIQFRLLREDFVIPLRGGISEFRSCQKKEGNQHMELQDIYVYHDVQIIEPKPTNEGVLYVTRFNVERLRRVQWERSRRLLYGSLVCLSPDNFETVLFAIVANRKLEELKEGLIELKFHQVEDSFPTLFSNTFTMVESPAYFEAYRHVLTRLQQIKQNEFPLERYIVGAEPRIEFPLYLRRNSGLKYDLSSVAHPGKVLKTVVSKISDWPPLSDFHLDPSQYEAFRAALTEELCLIQGPPGTGKTFIGLKIVETFLHNKQVWSPDNDVSPILVICFTNHALDQFLEGILGFLPEGIVRIGGRSCSEKLKEFNLNELRRNRSKTKKWPKHQYMQKRQIRDNMIKLAKKMQAAQKATKTANTKILKEIKLKEIMTHAQYVSLHCGFHPEETPKPNTGEYIAYWLGAVVGGFDLQGELVGDFGEEDLHNDAAPPLVIESVRTSSNHKRRRTDHVLEGQLLSEYIARNLKVIEEMNSHDVTDVKNVWSLNLVDRWRLYRYWVAKHQESLRTLLHVGKRAILRENVLKPFIKPTQWESLSGTKNQDLRVQSGQQMCAFLGVLHGDLDALTKPHNLVTDLNAIADEKEAVVQMRGYMRTHDEVCTLNVPQPMLVYIAKGLAQFTPLNKFEADTIDNVYELSYQNRWRLYKYWLSLYCKQLQKRLDVSQINLLREETLRAQMTDAQHESLNDPAQDKKILNVERGQLISLWLGAYSGAPIATVQKAIDALSQENGDIDILGEAEILNEERYIEDDYENDVNEVLGNTEENDNDDEDGVDIVGGSFPENEQGWNIAGRDRKKVQKYVNENIRRVDRMSEERALLVNNLWELQMTHRWDLYRYWVHEYKQKLQGGILPLQEEYERQVRLLKEVKEEENVEIINKATIIALTTTGAAKHHHLIHRVHPKVVIVEEAAEVLEAHIVTSLTEKCEHLILIGDHQQLRPNPTVYELATRFHLDISLFERLINNGFPRHRLNLQHRMRPEISQLLKVHDEFYPDLEDHEAVMTYEDIRGVEKNVFFLDHTFQESSDSDGHSRSNKFEAEFLTSLCRYLLQQDYRPENITILTAYTGQLWIFKSLMPKLVFKNVRVCPIDRFQGEENDIILLSLVRSNKQGNAGFLKIANRVCVALSRAKKGLYCVGNFTLLSGQNDLWKTITNTLRSKGFFGKSMNLICSNHPEVVTKVRISKDFRALSEGGCTKPCGTRLECGHVCPLICHPRNAAHIGIKCTKQCKRPVCELNHPCTKLCYQECVTKCTRVIKKKMKCGHEQFIMCHKQHSTEIQCQTPCPLILQCGHSCKNKCGEACTSFCKEPIERSFQCLHGVPTICGQMNEECSEPCTEILKCGHLCQGTCGSCKRGRLHIVCNMPCMKILVCGHQCSSVCFKVCPPCEKVCENHCINGNCIKCRQLCTLSYRERRQLAYDSTTCIQLYGEACERYPINEPCHKAIRSGHSSTGLRGKKWPKKCRICDKDELTEILIGSREDVDLRFVELQDCGHIIEVNSLDTLMKHQREDDRNVFASQIKVCPECKAPIRGALLYRDMIKRALSGIKESKKQISSDWVVIRVKQERLRNDIIDEELKVPCEEDFGKQSMPGQSRKGFGNVAKTFLADVFQQVNRSASKARLTSLEYKMDMYKQLWQYWQSTKNIISEKGNDERKLLLESAFIDVLLWLNKVPCTSEQQYVEDRDFETESSNVNERKQLRFVELKDCGHIIEVNSFESRMKQSCEDDIYVFESQIKVCPECKVPVRKASRYRNIKSSLSGVEEAEKQIISNWVLIRVKQEQLREDVIDEELKIPCEEGCEKQSMPGQSRKRFASVAKAVLADVFQQVNCSASKARLTSLEYKMDMYKQLWEYWQNADNTSGEEGNVERKLLLESVFIDVLLWLNKAPCTSAQIAEGSNFGTETSNLNERKQIRFGELEDCKHSTEVKSLDTWMKQPCEDNIYEYDPQTEVCPECKDQIRGALRHRDIIKRALSGVEEAKKHTTSDWVVIRSKQEQLRHNIIDEELKIPFEEGCDEQIFVGQNQNGFANVAKTFLADVFQQVHCSASKERLTSLEYKMDRYKQLWEYWQNTENISNEKGNDERKLLLESVFIDVLLWLNKVPCTSEQNAEDWDFEVKRIYAIIKVMEVIGRVSVTQIPPNAQSINEIDKILSDGLRYSVPKQYQVVTLLQELFTDALRDITLTQIAHH